MHYMVQCSGCSHVHGVNALQLAQQASRWACPICGVVTDYAQHQLAQPGLSSDAKDFWSAVFFAGLFVGLVMAADRLSQKLSRVDGL